MEPKKSSEGDLYIFLGIFSFILGSYIFPLIFGPDSHILNIPYTAYQSIVIILCIAGIVLFFFGLIKEVINRFHK